MSTRYNHSDAPIESIQKVVFSVLKKEEILQHSVVQINTTELFDKNVPKNGGLYDLRMGTIEKNFSCQTCNCDLLNCQGHFGHIEMVYPVYNVSYIKTIFKVLQCLCIKCNRILIDTCLSNTMKPCVKFRMMLDLCKKMSLCMHCEFKQPKWYMDNLCI